ncbi:MAG: DegT/DnrJ/EryC1/StrS family aminotransferase [Pseudomonadota bacterium]
MSILAIDGGTPVRTKPWQDNFTTGEEEKAAAIAALDSGYLSLFEGSHHPDLPFSFRGGPFVQKLEDFAGQMMNTPHVVAVNSATSGLYMAIGALGLGYGDEVIVSPYTMSACAVAPIIYGAIPIFADIDEDLGSLDPISIESRITPRTRAILVVHQFGIPARMDEIMAIARKHKLKVIEDCAQAWGAKYNGRSVGTIGDIGVFSFNVNKTIQSGEGGLCVTSDADLAYRLQLIRNHGEAVVGPAGYTDITNMLGYNYRMTEILAAIALEQLRKLDHLNTERLELVHRLLNGLAAHDCFALPPKRPEHYATFYVMPIRYRQALLGVARNDFTKAVNAEGIQFHQAYVRPLYLQPLYQQKNAFKAGYPWAAPENAQSRPNYSMGCCPVAERLHFEEMLINEHIRPPHTATDMDDILKAVEKVATEFSRRQNHL